MLRARSNAVMRMMRRAKNNAEACQTRVHVAFAAKQTVCTARARSPVYAVRSTHYIRRKSARGKGKQHTARAVCAAARKKSFCRAKINKTLS